eukprot:CAMPEP_0172450414 /NCGR_PEP_ID=MMETSP1065-20121228/8755_1 /TAXON_ID=265537 /ORGANISM="Amphiprora paludosa, Strain CCMP125" /LENGTH=1261 /DNA_ID=CAMNT_0013202195 /DNA_START=111 /DNA_END=3896 /DNA_ORIENTATION=+
MRTKWIPLYLGMVLFCLTVFRQVPVLFEYGNQAAGGTHHDLVHILTNPLASFHHRPDKVSILGKSDSTTEGWWQNEYNLVHVVETQFMEHQAHLQDLGQARLKLFKTFTLPSMIQQTSKQYLWIIWTDPNLNGPVLDSIIQIVSRIPNAVLMARDSADSQGSRAAITDFRSLYNIPESDVSRHILEGNAKLVIDYHIASQSRLLVETRLDADDAVARNFVESVQNHAARTIGQQVDNEQRIQMFCPEHHVEWRYYKPQDEEYEQGHLIHFHNKQICINSGLSVAYHLHATHKQLKFLDSSNQSYNNVQQKLPMCDGGGASHLRGGSKASNDEAELVAQHKGLVRDMMERHQREAAQLQAAAAAVSVSSEPQEFTEDQEQSEEDQESLNNIGGATPAEVAMQKLALKQKQEAEDLSQRLENEVQELQSRLQKRHPHYVNAKNSNECWRTLEMKGEEKQSVNSFQVAIVLARTPLAAGMNNVLPKRQFTSRHSLELPSYETEDDQKRAWESIMAVEFHLHANSVRQMRQEMEQNMQNIIVDALAGQCTKGHSCKPASKKALLSIVDMLNEGKSPSSSASLLPPGVGEPIPNAALLDAEASKQKVVSSQSASDELTHLQESIGFNDAVPDISGDGNQIVSSAKSDEDTATSLNVGFTPRENTRSYAQTTASEVGGGARNDQDESSDGDQGQIRGDGESIPSLSTLDGRSQSIGDDEDHASVNVEDSQVEAHPSEAIGNLQVEAPRQGYSFGSNPEIHEDSVEAGPEGRPSVAVLDEAARGRDSGLPQQQAGTASVAYSDSNTEDIQSPIEGSPVVTSDMGGETNRDKSSQGSMYGTISLEKSSGADQLGAVQAIVIDEPQSSPAETTPNDESQNTQEGQSVHNEVSVTVNEETEADYDGPNSIESPSSRFTDGSSDDVASTNDSDLRNSIDATTDDTEASPASTPEKRTSLAKRLINMMLRVARNEKHDFATFTGDDSSITASATKDVVETGEIQGDFSTTTENAFVSSQEMGSAEGEDEAQDSTIASKPKPERDNEASVSGVSADSNSESSEVATDTDSNKDSSPLQSQEASPQLQSSAIAETKPETTESSASLAIRSDTTKEAATPSAPKSKAVGKPKPKPKKKTKVLYEGVEREYIIPKDTKDIRDLADSTYEVEVYVKSDDHPEHIGFSLYNKRSETMVAERQSSVEGEKIFVVPIQTGHYIFEVTDSEGDGLCCTGEKKGKFELYVNKKKLVEGTDFGSTSGKKEFKLYTNGFNKLVSE